MGSQRIFLLEKKPLMTYRCQRCKEYSRRNKFSWKSWFKDDELIICRDCAYKESFGTKNVVQAKRENKLEQEKNDK